MTGMAAGDMIKMMGQLNTDQTEVRKKNNQMSK
jgi:hypothetical protein